MTQTVHAAAHQLATHTRLVVVGTDRLQSRTAESTGADLVTTWCHANRSVFCSALHNIWHPRHQPTTSTAAKIPRERRRTRARRRPSAQPAAVTPVGRAARIRGAGAVSYTHLTLPTICSV
eukprot:12570096-Alexandrium_andersonii.AAC.1